MSTTDVWRYAIGFGLFGAGLLVALLFLVCQVRPVGPAADWLASLFAAATPACPKCGRPGKVLGTTQGGAVRWLYCECGTDPWIDHTPAPPAPSAWTPSADPCEAVTS